MLEPVRKVDIVRYDKDLWSSREVLPIESESCEAQLCGGSQAPGSPGEGAARSRTRCRRVSS
eukprot:4104612-Pleurochrysis_carterae.AAC.1